MGKSRAYKHASLVFAAVVVGTVVWVNAGPLTPPSGAISSTSPFGSGTEINQLPFTINSPGRYYLARNLGDTGSAGITIQISNVTVDLNGFLLGGGTGSAIVCTGVVASRNVTIKNGTISGWTGAGVDTAAYGNCRLESLRVSHNGSTGIAVGDNTIVSGCVSSNNTIGILSTGSGCLIKNVAVYQNSADGIQANAATIANCASFNNGREFNGTGNTITNCSATGNVNHGFSAAESVIQGCVARGNSGTGITAGNSLLIGNLAVGNSPSNAVLTSGTTSVNNHGF